MGKKNRSNEPQRGAQCKEAKSWSEKTTCKNNWWGISVSKFSAKDVSNREGGKEGSVDFREGENWVASFTVKLLLHCGTAFSREVSHEVTSKRNKESPSLISFQTFEMGGCIVAFSKRCCLAWDCITTHLERFNDILYVSQASDYDWWVEDWRLSNI